MKKFYKLFILVICFFYFVPFQHIAKFGPSLYMNGESIYDFSNSNWVVVTFLFISYIFSIFIIPKNDAKNSFNLIERLVHYFFFLLLIGGSLIILLHIKYEYTIKTTINLYFQYMFFILLPNCAFLQFLSVLLRSFIRSKKVFFIFYFMIFLSISPPNNFSFGDISGLSYILNGITKQVESRGIDLSYALFTIEKMSSYSTNLEEIFLSGSFMIVRMFLLFTSIFGVYAIFKLKMKNSTSSQYIQ